MSDVDVYRIARLLLEEHGVFAQDEIKEKIAHFKDKGDANALKVWHEIDAALFEINKAASKAEERVN